MVDEIEHRSVLDGATHALGIDVSVELCEQRVQLRKSVLAERDDDVEVVGRARFAEEARRERAGHHVIDLGGIEAADDGDQ